MVTLSPFTPSSLHMACATPNVRRLAYPRRRAPFIWQNADDDAAARVVGQLQAEQGVEKVNYLSCEDALGEFRNWSGFGGVRWTCWKRTRRR